MAIGLETKPDWRLDRLAQSPIAEPIRAGRVVITLTFLWQVIVLTICLVSFQIDGSLLLFFPPFWIVMLFVQPALALLSLVWFLTAIGSPIVVLAACLGEKESVLWTSMSVAISGLLTGIPFVVLALIHK